MIFAWWNESCIYAKNVPTRLLACILHVGMILAYMQKMFQSDSGMYIAIARIVPGRRL